MSERMQDTELLRTGYSFVNHIRYLDGDYELDDSYFIDEIRGYTPFAHYDPNDTIQRGFVLIAGERFRCIGNIPRMIAEDRVQYGNKNVILKGVDLEAFESGNEDFRVAIKYLRPNIQKKGRVTLSDQMRIFKEGRVVSMLHHPNIVRFVDSAGELINGVCIPGFVMEHLYDLPQELSMADISEILLQISSALDYAHSKGVYHRDVQIGNILHDRAGRYVLTDFQIAHTEELKMGEENTTEYCITYADPQQIHMQDHELKERADIHALAVTAYNLISVKPYPFGSRGHRKPSQRLAPIERRSIPQGMRENIEEVLEVATSWNREDRYASCGELAAELIPCLLTGVESFDKSPLR